MSESIFENPERMAEALGLPNDVRFSVIGSPALEYQTRLTQAVEDLAGAEAVHAMSYRESRKGKYMSYRFTVFMATIEEVEAFYRVIGALPGTRAVL